MGTAESLESSEVLRRDADRVQGALAGLAQRGRPARSPRAALPLLTGKLTGTGDCVAAAIERGIRCTIVPSGEGR